MTPHNASGSRPYVLPGLHPYCGACGWRKGGVDSWDGYRCKCGHTAPDLDTADLQRSLLLECACDPSGTAPVNRHHFFVVKSLREQGLITIQDDAYPHIEQRALITDAGRAAVAAATRSAS